VVPVPRTVPESAATGQSDADEVEGDADQGVDGDDRGPRMEGIEFMDHSTREDRKVPMFDQESTIQPVFRWRRECQHNGRRTPRCGLFSTGMNIDPVARWFKISDDRE